MPVRGSQQGSRVSSGPEQVALLWDPAYGFIYVRAESLSPTGFDPATGFQGPGFGPAGTPTQLPEEYAVPGKLDTYGNIPGTVLQSGNFKEADKVGTIEPQQSQTSPPPLARPAARSATKPPQSAGSLAIRKGRGGPKQGAGTAGSRGLLSVGGFNPSSLSIRY